MPTIHDLPLETLDHIITLACPASPITKVALRERNQVLLAVALVRRAWTPFAQQELWLDVVVVESNMDGFIAAGPGRYPVQRLNLTLFSAKEGQTEAILRSVRGVRELVLMNGSVNMNWLCGDNFKDLKSLTLYRTPISTSPGMTTLPFHLTTLDLSYQKESSSFEFLDALSRQSSITSLSVDVLHMDPTRLLGCLARLAPHLDSLEIMFRFTRRAPAREFLKDYTQLKHLTLGALQMRSVDHLAVSLASWTIGCTRLTDVHELLDVLDSKCIAVSELDQLILRQHSTSELRTSPRWAELEQRCRERKIKLVAMDREGNRI